MSQSLPHRPSEPLIQWWNVFRLPVPLQRESALFLIVNVLDVLMTYILLTDVGGVTGRSIFYESNPVARFFLQHWSKPDTIDFRAMVYFKFSIVALVEVIAYVVANRKIEIGRRLLEFGTLLVSVVVIYSMVLLMRLH
jgi:Domain of unknown function (DUF5658)